MLKKLLTKMGFISRPFTHNPEDFKIKLEPWSYHPENFYVKYSANGGESWKYVYTSESPFLGSLDYDWEWGRWWGQQHNYGFETVRREFSSYQAILNYEAERRKMMEEGQAKHSAERLAREENIYNKYKKFEK